MMDVDPGKFAIMYNLWQLPCRCAVCNRVMYPLPGPELCLAASGDPVCRFCGVLYAPELVTMLQAWERATRRDVIAAHRTPQLTPSA